MSNMSYCRFENTYNDLADCRNAIQAILDGDEEEACSSQELNKAGQLIQTCQDILETLANASGFDVEETDKLIDFFSDVNGELKERRERHSREDEEQ